MVSVSAMWRARPCSRPSPRLFAFHALIAFVYFDCLLREGFIVLP